MFRHTTLRPKEMIFVICPATIAAINSTNTTINHQRQSNDSDVYTEKHKLATEKLSTPHTNSL